MYFPFIDKIDSAAIELDSFDKKSSRELFCINGHVQQLVFSSSPYNTGRRFFNAQWCWALGHIGILYQMVRWFKLHSPQTELILETEGRISNVYFLSALKPFVTIVEKLPGSMQQESMYNAVYFGCPDGVHHVHDFMKIAEKACHDIHLLKLTSSDINQAQKILSQLNLTHPYVAVQARQLAHDEKRNVTLEQVENALAPYLAQGYSVINTGLDDHPILQKYPHVKSLPDPHLASFLLSANCDQFIGSDSGAWVIPWAYQKPVELINDKSAAWIYE